jgi:hypothetical protein
MSIPRYTIEQMFGFPEGVVTIQRWGHETFGSMVKSGEGVWVTYADHLAAVAAAEKRGAEQVLGRMDKWVATTPLGRNEYLRGQRDERERIVTLVTALLFRKDGRLHAVGSSVDEGPGVEFCCSCRGNEQAAAELIKFIKGGSDEA